MPNRDPDNLRRADDRAVMQTVTEVAAKAEQAASSLDTISAWATKWRALIGLAVAVFLGLAGAMSAYGSWAGAQVSAPGKRIGTLEGRHDSLLAAVRAIEVQRAADRRTSDSVNAVTARRTLLNLRITCAGMDPRLRDLLDDCRELGATR